MKYLGCTVTFTLLLLAASVYPYGLQYLRGNDKSVLKWRDGRIDLRVSESLLTDVPDVRERDETLSAIRRAIGHWENAAAVEFRLGFTDIESVSPVGRSGDGVSLITIAQTPENLLLFSGKNSSAAAYTRVFYDKRGFITEADVVLNPYFAVSTKGTAGSFDLESAVTHEIGHVLGLGHSSIFSAVMFQESGRNGLYGIPAAPEVRLSSDDLAGARALYGAPKGISDCCASVRVERAKGSTGDFRVWAVETDSGRIVVSADSDGSGAVELVGLSAGEYEIFGKGLDDEFTAARRLGDVTVQAGGEAEIGPGPKISKTAFVLRSVGFNGQLSNIAVPLNPGNTYRVYVGGVALSSDLEFFVRSPYFSIDKTTIERIGRDASVQVVSFLVEVKENAQFGDYPVVVSDKGGGQQWLLGAITIGNVKNPWPVLQF